LGRAVVAINLYLGRSETLQGTISLYDSTKDLKREYNISINLKRKDKNYARKNF